jgi:putative ATP-dependent endonuclease of the OLD family
VRGPLVRRVRIRGFGPIGALELAPGRVCALVGEAATGKSTVLEALSSALDGHGSSVELEYGDGRPGHAFYRAASRTHELGRRRSPSEAAIGLVELLERQAAEVRSGTVFLIEEPELYLRPQTQRYLYRLLQRLAAAGNQVIYSTHSPAFLNVTRLEELAFVRRVDDGGTEIHQPGPLPWRDEAFELANDFDAERAELFLARGALLVEGRTEKLVFPFVFRALGRDVDAEALTIVDCGGKSRIVPFAQVCALCRIPFVAVHDRDSRPGGRPPIPAERALNELIARTIDSDRLVVLDPDLEGTSGLRAHRHKPEHAWERFVGLPVDRMPEPLTRAARRLLALAG